MKTIQKSIALFSIGFLLLFASCKKEKNEITGIVKEYGTNTPIADAEVSLWSGGGSNVMGNLTSYPTVSKTTKTDVSGHFSFDKVSLEGKSVSAGKEGYINSGQCNSVNDPISLILIPQAFIKIHLIDMPPFVSCNHITLEEVNLYNSLYIDFDARTHMDTTFFHPIAGNMYPNKIESKTASANTMLNITEVKHDTLISCHGRDTVSLTIYY